MARITRVTVILLSSFIYVESHSVSLDETTGDGTWTVKNENGTYLANAAVPGGIYTDLRAADVLSQDIYFRFNDIEYRWVSKKNWIYSRAFELPENVIQRQEIFLVFHGVDTIASIYLNGQHVGNCENMFVRYTFPIKSFAQIGTNIVEVRFQSPIVAAQERYDYQAQTYIVPPDCVPSEYQGECHINHLRKMQASFSWDWGPAFPSVGLWKSVEVEAFDVAVLRDVATDTIDSDDIWYLYINTFLEAGSDTSEISGTISATLDLSTTNFTVSKNSTLLSYAPGQFNASLVIEIPKSLIETWWPNGYGVQKLYPLSVAFSSENDLSEKLINIGFRTIELIQDPVEIGTGLTFYLKVNKVPIFAKGSNWIPSHILPEKSAEPERIEYLLESSRSANMNMLRVWGGGVYESDLFYKLADEKGLLIWQDFMFACNMYPTTEEFLRSVSTEITQQVRRMQHHPSVAVWAGNNENEGALRDNWYGTGSNFELYKSDYIKLYVDTIRTVTLAQDSSRPFVISSPSNGIETEQEGYVSENPGSSFYGDIHYYNYIADAWDPNTFKSTRFSSEYGFQSMPSFEAFAQASQPEDWSLDSSLLQHRQHHPNGNLEIQYEIGLNLNLPSDLSNEDGFRTFIYMSHINQAMAVKTATEFYRRGRSLLASDGQGLTMGALYWQLNDIWQAPSWASIEFNGRWKMLHYFAKDFFAPLLVSPLVTNNQDLQVHLISDHLEDIQSILTVSVYKWDSLSAVYTVSSNYTANKASVTKVFQQNLLEFLKTAGCGETDPVKTCFLYFTLTNSDGVNISPNNYLFPNPLKELVNFGTASITVGDVSLISESEKVFEIKLQADRIALFVWLETNNISGHFSSNGFHMVTPDVTVNFVADQDISTDQLRQALNIVSLADFY